MNDNEQELAHRATEISFADALALGGPLVQPRPELKRRIMAAALSRSPNEYVPAAAGEWRRITRGVTMKTVLQRDGYTSAFLRLEAQATLPGHGHVGFEEVCVVRGSCSCGPLHLRQGDYFRSEAGTTHGDIVAHEECVLFVTSLVE